MGGYDMHITPARGFNLESYIAMKLLAYLKETRAEFKHVSWPSRKQAIVYTAVVIVISLLTAAYLGALDYIFTTLLKLIV